MDNTIASIVNVTKIVKFITFLKRIVFLKLTFCIQASYLPMSIIIVGVGSADFAGMTSKFCFELFLSMIFFIAMDFLDSDKGSLAFQGRRAQRDIVQVNYGQLFCFTY